MQVEQAVQLLVDAYKESDRLRRAHDATPAQIKDNQEVMEQTAMNIAVQVLTDLHTMAEALELLATVANKSEALR
jgi:hypothetical protein